MQMVRRALKATLDYDSSQNWSFTSNQTIVIEYDMQMQSSALATAHCILKLSSKKLSGLNAIHYVARSHQLP